MLTVSSIPASSTNPQPPAFTINAAFWVALSSSDITLQKLSTPKYEGQSIGFTIHDNTDFQAGPSYGNPAVQDFHLEHTSDIESCMSLCTQYNFGLPPNDGSEAPLCSGVVFFVDGSCWLKWGLGENSRPVTNNQAMAAVLHFFV